MARLNEKDLELVQKKGDVDLSLPSYNYLGGDFLTNEADYIEVFIYDTEENFLESTIANAEDYSLIDDGSVKLKTGTILRKMGYDRGKFVVKYNFLRKVAGSYENVLVNTENNIYNGEYHVLPNGQIRSGVAGNDTAVNLYLKEYKYYIHKISSTRKELRLAPQPIQDVKYLKDFYYAQRTRKTVQSDESEESGIFFKNTVSDQTRADTNVVQFIPVDGAGDSQFLKQMVGGTLIIKNAFITGYDEFPTPVTPGTATENEEQGTMQAQFRLIREGTFTERSAPASYGDIYFRTAFEAFKGTNGQSPAANVYPTGITQTLHTQWFVTPSGGVKMQNITRLGSVFSPVWVQYDETDNGSTVVLQSNSILPNLDIPTTYEWKLSGWEWKAVEGRSYGGEPDYHEGIDFNRISIRDGISGQFTILGGGDSTQAVPDSIIPSQAMTSDSTDGSTLQFKIYGKDVSIGVSLTVSQATGVGQNATSTLFLPCIIERR